MTVRGADCLAYDQANRLKTLDTACNSSTDASYTYDGDGKRVSKTVASTTTSYVYDANRGLPVVLEDGTRRYVWGLGLAYEVETATNTALVYHVDGLGSVRAITDSTKAVVQTYQSDEFGAPITSSGGSAQPFSFTGEQRDPEGSFVYLRARLYDPTAGRLIQRDRVGVRLAVPQLQNRFAYALNNPTNLADPSGLSPEVVEETPEFYSVLPGDEVCEMRRIPLSGPPTDVECGGGFGGRGGRGYDGAWGARGGGGGGGFRGRAARGFDWEHIFENHSDWGNAARQRRQAGTGTFFEGLTEQQIKARVQAAWANRQRVRIARYPTEGDREVYRGTDLVSGQTLEFYYNPATGIVETAYPIP
jgi:RHS repeat-associated protein